MEIERAPSFSRLVGKDMDVGKNRQGSFNVQGKSNNTTKARGFKNISDFFRTFFSIAVQYGVYAFIR